MKFDLKGFQRISKEGNITKLRHPSGHDMSINHSILSPKMRGEIEALPQINKNKSPDSQSKPHFDDGGEVKNHSIVDDVIKMGKEAFSAPTPKPTPNPVLEDKYSKIRKQNNSNMSGETSPVGQKYYAEGTKDEPVRHEVQGEEINVPVSRLEAQYGAEEDAVNKELDADPKVQLEDQANGITTPVESQPVSEQGPDTEGPADPAQSMLNAHNSAMDSHNLAMKLFAAAQPQPQNQSVQPAAPAQVPQQAQPPASTQQPAAPTQTPDQSQQVAPDNQQPIEQKPVDNSYQGEIDQANQGVQDLKSYIDKQEASNEKLGQAVLAGKVDPNHLYKNMSTGGKIASVIGLILGGIGAGATGGKNYAVDAMQKAIDNDVDAQKANQSNQMNLYKMNLEATHNEVEARSLTVNQLASAAQAQIAKRAADTTNQNAQLQAQEAIQKIQQLKMENAQTAYKYKLMQSLGDSTNIAPGGIDSDKFNKLQMAGVISPGDVSTANKEAKEYQEKVELQKNMEDSAKHLEKQIGAGIFTPGDRQSATQAFAGRIAKLAEGRFNLQESELQAKALLPQPGDLHSTLKNKEARRKQFFDSMAPTPTLDRYRLINRQEAPVIKKMGGVSYQLGKDGNYHKLGK